VKKLEPVVLHSLKRIRPRAPANSSSDHHQQRNIQTMRRVHELPARSGTDFSLCCDQTQLRKNDFRDKSVASNRARISVVRAYMRRHLPCQAAIPPSLVVAQHAAPVVPNKSQSHFSSLCFLRPLVKIHPRLPPSTPHGTRDTDRGRRI